MKLDSLAIDSLAEAMSLARNPEGKIYYLDTKHGQVLSLSEELLTAILRNDESEIHSLPETDREDIAIAREVIHDEDYRFLQIPEIEKRDEFYWMAYFTEMVTTPGVYEAMRAVVDVSKKIEDFRRILQRNPAERGLWKYFWAQKKREEAEDWLETLDLPPVRKPVDYKNPTELRLKY